MIQNEPCVNGILAAVLSASVIPLHGALAKEKSARLQKAIGKSANVKSVWPDAPTIAVVKRQAPSPAQ
ncbi:hypothetical protein [Methylocystis echinoides]|uniref:hypothetical protein n=1 Tax=Methylocystis echinoides TaxID=29468 RepID=UPI0034414C58